LIPQLSLTDDPIPGDIDRSGTVDRADAALFAASFGRGGDADWSSGDFDGDRRTTLSDLAMLQARLAAPPAASSTATNVPEPSAIALAAMIALFGGASAQGGRRTNR
jgi:hypothetical protein